MKEKARKRALQMTCVPCNRMPWAEEEFREIHQIRVERGAKGTWQIAHLSVVVGYVFISAAAPDCSHYIAYITEINLIMWQSKVRLREVLHWIKTLAAQSDDLNPTWPKKKTSSWKLSWDSHNTQTHVHTDRSVSLLSKLNKGIDVHKLEKYISLPF